MLGMAVFATGAGLVGTAAAAANAPTCSDVHYSGAGNTDDPYEVGNVSQLQCINGDHGDADSRSDALSANYTLANDIDASGTKHWNGGKGFEPIGDTSTYFTGALDGNGHEISNVTIDRPNESSVGLFGYSGAHKNPATIENVTLSGITVIGGEDTGGLVGTVWLGTIENTGVTATVDGHSGTGGVIGFNDGGAVRNVSSSGSVNGSTYVGGLVGVSGDGEKVISNSSSTSDVTGRKYVGGLAGGRYGYKVRNSFAAGEVTGDSNVGGLW